MMSLEETYDFYVASVGHENIADMADEILSLRKENEKLQEEARENAYYCADLLYENKNLKKMLENCARDLESHINDLYRVYDGKVHPAAQHSYDKSMKSVYAARIVMEEDVESYKRKLETPNLTLQEKEKIEKQIDVLMDSNVVYKV